MGNPPQGQGWGVAPTGKDDPSSSAGLALAGSWTPEILSVFYWWLFSSLGGLSTLSLLGWVAARTKASVGEGRRPEEGEADCRHLRGATLWWDTEALGTWGQHKVTES